MTGFTCTSFVGFSVAVVVFLVVTTLRNGEHLTITLTPIGFPIGVILADLLTTNTTPDTFGLCGGCVTRTLLTECTDGHVALVIHFTVAVVIFVVADLRRRLHFIDTLAPFSIVITGFCSCFADTCACCSIGSSVTIICFAGITLCLDLRCSRVRNHSTTTDAVNALLPTTLNIVLAGELADFV